jgi:very-short-patch-repair endonuclease
MARKKHNMASVRARTKKPRRLPIAAYANQLRSKMTKAEIILWGKLQYAMKKWNVVFIPQGIVCHRFIADFVCYEKRLVVECDGSIHNRRAIKRKDNFRTTVLNKLGYTVVRFTNTEVLNNTYGVLNSIKELL